jgi:hypothetical protein
MPKPINLSIRFRLPKDRKVAKASITPDGEIVFTDDAGNIVTPEYMERAVHYDRLKGPKIQTRNKTTADHVSIGGLQEFAQYDSVFVLDTNKKTIKDKEIAAACFVCCRFIPEGKQFRIECDGKLNVYEFHNVPANENPEMLAVLKVALDITSSVGSSKPPRIAFVSDSELGLHDKINAGQVPIYGNYHLPPGFVLHYASAETGQEAINRIIKFCDKQSSNYLRYLEEGSVKVSELNTLKEDPSVQYRYMFREDLEIVNPIVGGIAIQPGTRFALYGVKEPHNI